MVISGCMQLMDWRFFAPRNCFPTIVYHVVLKGTAENTAQYVDNVGTGHTSNNIREIMPAAYYGRVSSLFVAINQELWGNFDPTNNMIHVHKEPRFRDDDLLDEAATQTLLHGGAV